MSIIIGMDIGGTSLKIGAWNSDRRIAWRAGIDLPGSGEDRIVGDYLLGIIGDLCAGLPGDPVAIGVGSCGLISGKTIFQSPNTPWNKLPLGVLLEEGLDYPVFLLNDADAFLVQTLTTLPDDKAIVLGVTLGTGIGTGLWLGDRLFRGGAGVSPEGGHTTIHVDGKLGTSGIHGTWESMACRDAVLDYYEEAGGAKVADPKQIALACEQGEAAALVAWNRYGRMVGAGLGSLCNVLSPDYVMIGGGMSGARKWFEAPMNLALNRHMLEAMPKPDIHFFDEEPDMVAQGAALYAARKVKRG